MFYRPRIIPVLLLDNKKLVKTIKFKNPHYLGDPINAVKIFNEKMADELCILDITRTGKEIDVDFLHDIATEAFMPLSYGGGIRNMDQVETLFKIGFEKVIFNTCLVSNPGLVREAVRFAGSQSIVASIDVKRSLFKEKICYTDNGTNNSMLSPKELAQKAEELGVGEILLNSINNDGMMEGYDLDLLREISSGISIPLIVCGGAGKISDLKDAIDSGADAVAAGSIFVYYGEKKGILINYPTEQELIESGIFKN